MNQNDTIDHFIKLVDEIEKSGKRRHAIATSTLAAVRDYVRPIREARRRGGLNRHRKTVLIDTPRAKANREAQARFKAKKAKEIEAGAVIGADGQVIKPKPMKRKGLEP